MKKQECFDRAIELGPNGVDIYYSKGNTLISLLKKEEALDCFTAVSDNVLMKR